MAGKNNFRKMKRTILAAVSILIICLLFYNANTQLSLFENLSYAFSGRTPPDSNDFKPDNTGKFLFYTISTGNSDSLLMVAPGGESMLVDAADSNDFSVIEFTLKKYGIRALNIVVATHFDSDHIGSMDDIIRNMPVESVYLSNYKDNTRDYNNLMDAIHIKNLSPIYANSGMQFSLGDATIKILNPQDKKYKDSNDASIVLLVSYGTSDFLLTGDMEEEAMDDILQKWGDSIDSEVLKAAHHGSRTGISQDLMEASTPDIAIIPSGKDNAYGHPHKQTLDFLQKYNVKTYRTDNNGDIAVLTDGTNIEVYTQIAQ